MGWDIAILETGNGGDFTMKGTSDVQVFENDENEVYLRLFGGNIEADTKPIRKAGEEDRSYWANKLLFANDPDIQFNSMTERTIRATVLNSAGRQQIMNAVNKDLQGLNVDVQVSITGIDRFRLDIKNRVTGKVKSFGFVKNGNAGDFDLSDFSALDFL